MAIFRAGICTIVTVFYEKRLRHAKSSFASFLCFGFGAVVALQECRELVIKITYSINGKRN